MSDRARVCHNSGAAKKKNQYTDIRLCHRWWIIIQANPSKFASRSMQKPSFACHFLCAVQKRQLPFESPYFTNGTSAPLHGQQKENARHLNGHNPLVPFPGQKGFSTGICHLDNLQMENASLLHGPFRPPPNSLAARRSRRAACASAQLETAGANGPGCLAEPVVTEADRLVGSGQAGRAGLGWPRPGPRPNCGPTRCSQLTLVAKSKGPCR